MSRLVREVRAPQPEPTDDAQYAAPDGSVLNVPRDFAFADTVVALEDHIPAAPLSRPPPSQRPRETRFTGPPAPAGLSDPPTLPVPHHPPGLEPRGMATTPVATPRARPPVQVVDAYGQPLDAYGQPVDAYGRPVDAYGQPLDAYGQPLDAYGQPLDAHGQPMPLLAAAGEPSHDPGLVTRSRTAFERARTNVASARHEMKELWGATYDAERDARLANEEDPFVRLAGKLRRLRNMWGFFEWDQDDKMKALGIGIVVFAVVALAFFVTRQP